MIDDEERCYRAVKSKDQRFDGWFFVGVTSTGIFCRPSCPVTTPKRANVRFFPTAAAAAGAGFRACRRCRPDTAPGSPEWNVRSDLAARAMGLIDDGVADREGVAGLARRMAVSERHLHRTLVAELGASPVALARSRRAQTARLLIETTSLPFTEVAFAAGFSSIRQFNDTVRELFGATPTVLRADRTTSLTRSRGQATPDASSSDGFGTESGAGAVEGRGGARRGRAVTSDGLAPGPTPISLRLATRSPFAGPELIAFLAMRAIGGIEAVEGDTYHRVLRLPGGPATASIRAQADHVTVKLLLADLRDLGPAVARCRRLLDLDADPIAVAELLGADPMLGGIVRATPGRRAPAGADGTEMLVRAVVGQQVSVAGACTVAGRIAEALGDPLPAALLASPSMPAGLVRTFPDAAALARADPATFTMPLARATALTAACALVADGTVSLDPGADRVETERRLLEVKGIGPWTTAYLSMRALADPDVFLPTDLGVLRGLAARGGPSDPTAATAVAEAWRPWRTYALHHLWSAS